MGLFVVVMSVFYLVGFVAPVAERLLRLKPHQSDARDGTLRFRQRYLVVDELVAEIDVVGIGGGVAVVDFLYPAPVDGAEAHRTRFARRVDDAVVEFECTELAAGGTDGGHLGMGGGVVVRGDAVDTSSDHRALAHYDSAEGTAAVIYVGNGGVYRKLHEMTVLFCDDFFFVHDESRLNTYTYQLQR